VSVRLEITLLHLGRGRIEFWPGGVKSSQFGGGCGNNFRGGTARHKLLAQPWTAGKHIEIGFPLELAAVAFDEFGQQANGQREGSCGVRVGHFEPDTLAYRPFVFGILGLAGPERFGRSSPLEQRGADDEAQSSRRRGNVR